MKSYVPKTVSAVSTGVSSPKESSSSFGELNNTGLPDYNKMFEAAYGYKASTPRPQYSQQSSHRDTFFKKAPFKIASTTVSIKFQG